ncbi:MAG: FAD-dependent 5-carboxymethylaminomethyl-2-thiouridine(34) oxidoreductase MnmC [Pseudomonadales bacterium]|nr:FAD-dependent 5-carboxymethylaminomethyl-2-thiouridine(34) oxidoreductase MnmC [Pseudomonadales bacterium]
MTTVSIDKPLVSAQLRWNKGQPYSQSYDDIYHADDGINEVQRVLITPCQLQERFTELNQADFCIGELGFGTGLNFTVITDLFLKYAPPETRLHFISFEKHPLSQQAFRAMAMERSRQLPPYLDLSEKYPPLLSGWHKRYLVKQRVSLWLYFGDADSGISELLSAQFNPNKSLNKGVQHWILDGFSPHQNPDMWAPTLFQKLAALSAEKCTVATFTSVGQVRRDLQQAGFLMRKISQLPFKRHSLAGTRTSTSSILKVTQTPSILVVGGGIAGVCMASCLANQGIKVTLIDQPFNKLLAKEKLAKHKPNQQRASDISPAILHARLLADDSPTALMRSRMYVHASAWLRSNPAFKKTGVLQTLGPNTDAAKLSRVYEKYQHSGNWIQLLDSESASDIAGMDFNHPALYFPDSGSVDMGHLCSLLQDHPNIRLISANVLHIARVTQTGGRQSQWQATTSDGTNESRGNKGSSVSTKNNYYADHMVICPGENSGHFEQLKYLELTQVPGQLNTLKIHSGMKLPIIGAGFACPDNDNLTIGATYEHSQWSEARASQFNLERFKQWWPLLSNENIELSDITTGEVSRAIRSVARDRLPIIGGVFDLNQQALEGLWLSCAHGSSGLTSAPLAAEIIASEILGSPIPTDLRIAELCESLRFRARQARRGFRNGAS